MINLKALNTEKRNPRTMKIDQATSLEIVEMMNYEDSTIASAVQKELPKIAALIDDVVKCIASGGRVIYMGAGTSGRLGILDASECPPTYGVSPELFQGLIAGGQEAIFRAIEGAEDSEELGIEDLKRINVTSKDCVIGLAASGRTPYVISALKYANEIGAVTGSICCVEGGEISKVSKHAIEAVTGPEVVTGSTRLKAGTSQKLILNMISTGSMILSGKVYENLMVDVQATNAKLIVRSKTIISEALGCEFDEAEKLYYESGEVVKVAILMGLTDKTREEATALLDGNNGNISKTVQQLTK